VHYFHLNHYTRDIAPGQDDTPKSGTGILLALFFKNVLSGKRKRTIYKSHGMGLNHWTSDWETTVHVHRRDTMAKEHHNYLFSEGGLRCPLCGGRMARGSFFCHRCGRTRNFPVNANGTKAESKHIFLPRGIGKSFD
jgi:hypothetical protein